ncbi:unnamed protein product [Cochlearia groenlandica]
MIECRVPHFHSYGGICIDGVLYYPASTLYASENSMIVCFDVRFERFASVERHGDGGTLVDYNGKLGIITTREQCFVNESTRSNQLVLLSCKNIFPNL